MCSVQCAVCSVQCAVCSVQCAVCSVQCAVCSVQVSLLPGWTLHDSGIGPKSIGVFFGVTAHSPACAILRGPRAIDSSRVRPSVQQHTSPSPPKSRSPNPVFTLYQSIQATAFYCKSASRPSSSWRLSNTSKKSAMMFAVCRPLPRYQRCAIHFDFVLIRVTHSPQLRSPHPAAAPHL